MLEACVKVHQNNDSSFIGIMSDKNHVGPFPWKVETAIKSITPLNDMQSDKDLYEVLVSMTLFWMVLSSRSHVL